MIDDAYACQEIKIMLQNLLASMGVLTIVIVTFARMRLPPSRLLRQPAKSNTRQLRRRRPF